MATFIIALIVLAVVILAIWQLRKDKKAGKSLCGGKCSNCPNGGLCHGNEKHE
ncbi:MAG: FeoB-associated Cys-rich membrane protein [Oscillospiraceae bacterium]|nr:FeoB-associated Cys-rich membrane protein [Oscillospiraceae bacterium]